MHSFMHLAKPFFFWLCWAEATHPSVEGVAEGDLVRDVVGREAEQAPAEADLRREVVVALHEGAPAAELPSHQSTDRPSDRPSDRSGD